MDNAWKTDNYKFVGKTYDLTYKKQLANNALMSIIGTVSTNSIDYEITNFGDYGEMQPFDGTNLIQGTQNRGFKTIIRPKEFTLSDSIKYKQAKNDMTGECRKVGTKLSTAAFMTLFRHTLRMFHNITNTAYLGGDGKTWAATDHPNASKYSENRGWVADASAGTYSNLITSAFSLPAIFEANRLAQKYVSPSGHPLLGNYNLVLVSVDLEEEARKLFGVNNKLSPTNDPTSAENAANPLSDMKYMVCAAGVEGFVGKRWALCDPMLMKETTLRVETTKPTVMQHGDHPLIDEYTAYADFAVGWGEPRAIVFSNPA